jgi:hypothetical protein
MKTTKQWIWISPLLWGLMSFSIAVPAFGKTTKELYPNACGEVWNAVKNTLGNQENYKIVASDDAQMSAAYQPKHNVHVTVTGALTQRKNHVTLVPSGTGCEMQIVSNYSGFEHNDRDEFKKRVDESLAKPIPNTVQPQDANK